MLQPSFFIGNSVISARPKHKATRRPSLGLANWCTERPLQNFTLESQGSFKIHWSKTELQAPIAATEFDRLAENQLAAKCDSDGITKTTGRVWPQADEKASLDKIGLVGSLQLAIENWNFPHLFNLQNERLRSNIVRTNWAKDNRGMWLHMDSTARKTATS